MFGLFKKEEFKIVVPVDGMLIPLNEVPDQMFSQIEVLHLLAL